MPDVNGPASVGDEPLGDEPDDEPREPSASFDHDWVSGAVFKEAPAHDRIERANRIARDHVRLQQQWQAHNVRRPANANPQQPRRRRRGRFWRAAWGPLLVLLAAVVLLWPQIQQQYFAEGITPIVDVPWLPDPAGAVSVPPVPPDAAPQPLGAPASPPQGSGGYAFLVKRTGSDDPVTFDPCRPIHYVVRPDNAPDDGDARIQSAISEVSRATGLQFVSDGTTSEAPSEERAAAIPDRYGNRWAPVLIVWSDAGESEELAGSIAGLAGPITYGTSDPQSERLVSGIVMLDYEDLRLIGESAGPRPVEVVIMHELGHLVGLAHVDDETQVMHPENISQTDFGAGDLRGLHALGLGPCFSDGS